MMILGVCLIPARAAEEESNTLIIAGAEDLQEDSNTPISVYVLDPVMGGELSEVLLADIEPLADISPGYGVGTTNLSIFQGVAKKLPYGVHYVYYRESQYEYCLAYSRDLSLAGSRFTAPTATVVTYYTYTGGNSQPSYSVVEQSGFSLSASSYLVWSDLGDYPSLYERGPEDYAKLACVMLAAMQLFYLWRSLYSSIRQRYING